MPAALEDIGLEHTHTGCGPLVRPIGAHRVTRRYAVDFDALFCRAVREALAAVDPELPYLDSSPSNGLLCSDPWVKR